MGFTQTTINGYNIEGGEETRVGTEDVPDVHMSLAGEDRCNGDEWGGARAYCTRCNERLREDVVGEWHSVERDDDLAMCEDGEAHEPAVIPLSWANSASIRVNDRDDSITVAISTGDPRGAWTMTVERIRYTDAETGEERDELRLSVPTPDDLFPHDDLTPLASPGYYRIGR